MSKRVLRHSSLRNVELCATLSGVPTEDEPIPHVPWGTKVKEMSALRTAMGEAGFVQCFMTVMGAAAEGGGGSAVRITLTPAKKTLTTSAKRAKAK